MCFNPGPERRVPSPNRYIADAKFCFCKNNKRIIIINVNIITSIGTLLLLVNDTLILRGCNLSAILPRSTFTKYHLLASQHPCEIKPVATPKSDDVNCSAKFTCYKKFS